MPNRDYTRRILTWWVSCVERFHLAVVISFIAVTLGLVAYLATNFKINEDLTEMISDKLPFRQMDKKFFEEFPQLSDVIVIVIDGGSVGDAMDARQRIAERLRKDRQFFGTVYEPGGGEFFERNGLLFLDVKELEDLSDNLAQGEPLMGLLIQDYSLRGFFALIGTVVDNYDADTSVKVDLLFDDVGSAFSNVVANRPGRLSWEGLLYGAGELTAQKRQIIITSPVLDKDGMLMGVPPSLAVHRIISELNLDRSVKVRLTGDTILDYQNLNTVRHSVGLATFASLILVALVIFVGFGSGRLVISSFITLLTGLVWTASFAIFFIGSLNLISITFAVLFVGLGIDYGIQFSLRYRALMESGAGNRDSLITTANGVGKALLVSCITTAIGFFAFLPTAYTGVAQLGLISGVGMFISFFCNLTLLPAILSCIGFRKGCSPAFLRFKSIALLPYRYYRWVISVALVLTLCSATALPKVHFDYNPLNLYNPASEAVATLKDLFNDRLAPPWTISILCQKKDEAERLTERLGRLKEVKGAISIADFVPGEQEEKLRIISEMALFMPATTRLDLIHRSPGENMAALDKLEGKLEKFSEIQSGHEKASVTRLLDSVRQFRAHFKSNGEMNKAFGELEAGLLSGLPSLLGRLNKLLDPYPITEADIPKELKKEYVSVKGHYRVQVLPKENIMDNGALVRFVSAVKSVAPNAVDTPVTVYESGKAVASSCMFASLLALVAVILVLLLTLRSPVATLLVMMPLFITIALVSVISVVFNLPINYVNVIVLPLLLGVGVHSGIMFMLRCLTEPPADGNMLTTSTARAVLYSNLTMVISCVTLAFSAHRGIASMGILLTVSFVFILISILIVFPSLFRIFLAYRDYCSPPSH